MLTGEDRTTAAWFFDAIGWWQDAIETWDDAGGETVCALFVAALSHHGGPLDLGDGQPKNPPIWRTYGGLDPREQVRRVGQGLVPPAAFAPDAPRLPSAPAFQHMFLGLCTLADWIGSNEELFPYCDTPQVDYIDRAHEQAHRTVSAIGLDLAEQRERFAALFPHIDGGAPNAIQQAAARDTPLDDPIVIIESEAGSGKTEAAL